GVRAAAQKALGALSAQWRKTLLRESAVHPFRGRRAEAARSLGWLARFDASSELVDALSARASLDPSPDVRLTAIEALGWAASPRTAPVLAAMRKAVAEPAEAAAIALAQSRVEARHGR